MNLKNLNFKKFLTSSTLHVLAFGILAAPQMAHAYIPPYWMVMSRTADNHGHGVYKINQVVTFNSGEEPISVNEHWTIKDEDELRLDVTGLKQMRGRIRLTYVYHNHRRYSIDENGNKVSAAAPSSFIEPYFHFRWSKHAKQFLVDQKIAPAYTLRKDTRSFNEKNQSRETEDFMRLARTGGVIAYAVGTPTPATASEPFPGLWIEQDQFVIRKLRLKSMVEVTASLYKNFSHGLNLPAERFVTWPGQSARIILTSATPVALTPQIKSELNASSLSAQKDKNLIRIMPDDAVIRDFYSRIR